MDHENSRPTPQFARLVYRCANYRRVAPFYRDLLGLNETAAGRLSAADSEFELVFEETPDARAPQRAGVGLYHVAFLLPDRTTLASLLRRVLHHAKSGAAGSSQPPFRLEGAADHLVSEAVYLRDGENNGVELYADREPASWPRDARGNVRMTTEPLDFGDLLAESGRESTIPAGARIGHIHLHVPDLDQAEAIYRENLGMSVTQRDFPGARFLAWGRYHHHLGVNTWAGTGSPEPRAAGLISVAVRSPQGEAREFFDLCGIHWEAV